MPIKVRLPLKMATASIAYTVDRMTFLSPHHSYFESVADALNQSDSIRVRFILKSKYKATHGRVYPERR